MIIISHLLEEISAVGDRFLVMKQGRVVGERDVRDVNNADLVEMLVTGQDQRQVRSRAEGAGGRTAGG